jgi:NAD(P)-dependent dehydrogenase (short-subunit alcohol dehydrogenase family)
VWPSHTRRTQVRLPPVKAIELDGGKAIAIQADATDASAVNAAVEKIVTTFGQLDVLVNNAGTAIPKRFEDATLEELDRLIDLNIRGTFIATQAALKQMKSGGPAAAEKLWSPHYIQHSAHIEPGCEGLFNMIKSLPAALRSGRC